MRIQSGPIRSALIVFSIFALANLADAGLQIPYSPDANTTHLWHFDGSSTNFDGTTNVLTPDEVAAGGVTLTNVAQTQFPGAVVTLGNPSADSLGNAWRLVATNLALGNAYAMASAGPVTNASLINDTSGGAFTFEAILKMDISPFATSGAAQNWEIISGDNSANGTGTRGWQFRITTGPSAVINFNAAPGFNAAANNITVALPNSGPNAVVAGQWYHVAATFTGSAPTNSDPANVLTFYWTLLDANRTNADVLSVVNVQSGFGILPTVNSTLAVGGNGRANNGVGNGEGFKGYIDEVRLSVVARGSNEMAFTTGGALSAPNFAAEAPANTFLGFGQTLTLPTVVIGTLPIHFQWQQNSGGGFTDVANQTNNTLSLSNVTFAAAGSYRLIAANSQGSATGEVAQVSIGAAFSELFSTGLDANGASIAGGAGVFDPHYQMIESADLANLGPNATVWDMANAPVKSNGGRFSNADGLSQWIGPSNAELTPSGIYRYRTQFLIDQTDLNTATVHGTLWANLRIQDVILNGVSHGPLVANKSDADSFNFTLADGLKAGLNTLTFVTTNDSAAQDTMSALRVELSGLGEALAPGLPELLSEPADQVVRDASYGGGSVVTFSTVAIGRPPLNYQWLANGAAILDATNRTLTYQNPFAGGQGSSFAVIVSNDSGSVTSRVANLTLVMTNQPAIAPTYNFTISTNQTLRVNLSALLNATSDPDGDLVYLAGYDTMTTNNVALGFEGSTLLFVPPQDFTGADQFTYTVFDQFEYSVGVVNIHVIVPANPTLASVRQSSGSLILSGTGSAGASFHILSTTNLTSPIADWESVSAGVFDNAGQFNVTNAIAPAESQRFFILQTP